TCYRLATPGGGRRETAWVVMSLTACGEGSSVDDARPFGSIDELEGVLMLRKLLMTAGMGALVAMAIGGASFASASGGGEGGGRTIVVIEKTTSQKFLDLGKPGPTAGDEFFFASQFWNTARTHKVGSNRGFCAFETQTAAHCVGTAQLAGGTLEFAGEATITGADSVIAITGGTGAFDGAEGHVSIHNLN